MHYINELKSGSKYVNQEQELQTSKSTIKEIFR